MPDGDEGNGLNPAAAEAYQAKMAELKAFEAAPPAGWNYVGSPTWQQWMRLKEEVLEAETQYYAQLAIKVQEKRLASWLRFDPPSPSA